MIYWDNAATTWPKPMAVTEAMSRALTRYGAIRAGAAITMGMAASREVYPLPGNGGGIFPSGQSGPSGVYPELHHGHEYGSQRHFKDKRTGGGLRPGA